MQQANIKNMVILSILFTIVSSHNMYAQMFLTKDSITSNGETCRIFTQNIKQKNSKTKPITYLLVEQRSDISLGCKVYRLEEGNKISMNDFCVAAYTKDESQRMNYNSILPYISMCQSGNRIILSFECDFIVMNPDKMNEKIINTTSLYGIIGESGIELKNFIDKM